MSYYDQLQQFKTAVRATRYGAADDTKAYEKVIGMSGGVPLIGPYGFRADEWPTLAEQAGIPGARWQDRGAQESVADYLFTALFNRYGGRWDGVATAWEAGTKVADRIILNGEPIEQVVKQSEQLTRIVTDVTRAIDTEPIDMMEFAVGATAASPFATAPLGEDRPRPAKSKVDPEAAVIDMLTAIRDKQVAGKEVESGGTLEDGEQGLGGNVAPGTTEGGGI